MIHHFHRPFFVFLGVTSLFLGIIGIFLPLLPTTPFILLAAYCFSRSSQRMHNWLIQHKVFGKLIADWEEHGVIRTKIKWIATISMVVMVSYPVIFIIPYLWLKLVTVSIIGLVLIFIWTRPSQARDE